jgi:hypothetical protein
LNNGGRLLRDASSNPSGALAATKAAVAAERARLAALHAESARVLATLPREPLPIGDPAGGKVTLADLGPDVLAALAASSGGGGGGDGSLYALTVFTNADSVELVPGMAVAGFGNGSVKRARNDSLGLAAVRGLVLVGAGPTLPVTVLVGGVLVATVAEWFQVTGAVGDSRLRQGTTSALTAGSPRHRRCRPTTAKFSRPSAWL